MSMLKHISIDNFKCFRKGTFALGDLTLLAGTNGSGKSTTIQALLVLRQSFQQDLLQEGRLALNGELVRIGSGQDALFEDAEREVIEIGLEWRDGTSRSWAWDYAPESRVLTLTNEASVPSELDEPGNPFTDSFCYLSADRIPPASFFSTSVPAVEGRRHLGARGEFTAHFLAVFRNETIPCPNLVRESEPPTLLRQTEAWLNVIRPGLRLEVNHHPFMDIVELSFQFRVGRRFGGRYRTTNVGFGLTYILPVIVALLATRPGGLVIVENPEAHLHPRGQSQIGALCALAAAAGVQVLVETHSDHVLNGIRIAVREGQLAPQKVETYFFGASDKIAGSGPEIHNPSLDGDGRFDSWPNGFFDEWDRALDKLLE